jgi:hypothetical protein
MLAYFVESLPSYPLQCLTRTLPLCVYPLLRCTDFDIVQLLPTSAIDIQDKPHQCPRRTLRSTDHNTATLRISYDKVLCCVGDGCNHAYAWRSDRRQRYKGGWDLVYVCHDSVGNDP